MNNAFFEKTIENVRKDRDVKIVITEAISNYLGSEPNYHITKFFFRKFISSRNEKNTDTYE